MDSQAGRPNFDVAIVGGGPAGLQAALILGRMRRRVVVFDTGDPANEVEHSIGGLLSRDGVHPRELREVSREQLAQYESVELRDAEVTATRAEDGGFAVVAGGEEVRVRRLVLAHGLDYGLPEIEGLAELWGERAFHCPYCHGWEVREKRIGIVADSPKAVRGALLLGTLSDDLTLVLNGCELEDDHRETLDQVGARAVEGPVARVAAAGEGVEVHVDGAEPLRFDAIFIQPNLSLRTDLAVELGAELADDGTIAVGGGGVTSVPGLHAAGDAGPAPQSAAVAVGAGADAAYAIHAALALDDVGAAKG